MPLADTFESVRSGIFHIVFLNDQNLRIASGSAFITRGYLVTNHHVFLGPPTSRVWIRNEAHTDLHQGVLLSYQQFAARLRSGSDRNNFDFAVLEIPELFTQSNVHQLELDQEKNQRIGSQIAFLGYPLEHLNLTCHTGVISSFFESGPATMVQLDASVNPSNSGGPLVDANTGRVIGIITRKATGLTQAFSSLRQTIQNNLTQLRAVQQQGTITMFGINPLNAIEVGQSQMLTTLDEIERQANVGIGYAISIKHLLNDNVLTGDVGTT